MDAWPGEARELVGVLHIHTRFSDGSGSPGEIAGIARTLGLDFIGINDHMSLGARRAGFGGWDRGLLVLAGAELEDRWLGGHHLLVYGIDEIPSCRRPEEMIDAVNSSGGIAIAAHPRERRGHLPMTRSIRWRSVPKGLGGVEVWNYMSQWKAGVTLLDLRRRLGNPDDYVKGPSRDDVAFWERAGGCAVAGPDAHAFVLGAMRWRKVAFPYEMLLSRLRTHVLLDRGLPDGDYRAEASVLDALRRGICFVSNAMLGDARGFRAIRGNGALDLHIPGPGRLAVSSGGGRAEADTRGGREVIAIPPVGPVTVEILREGSTWIWCGLSWRSC
jgi:hypothetical protein